MDGSVIFSTVSITCQASRFCRLAMTSDLYSAASSLRAVGGRLVVDQFGLHPECGARTGDAGADPGAAAGAQHGGRSAAGEAADLLDGGDDAECGIAIVQSRGEQHLADARRQCCRRIGCGGAADLAASTAACAGSSSSIGTTMPGRTTTSVSESTGSRRISDM